MTKIIGLIQVKGGAGRSTISTTIAGELGRSHQVVLIDCDMPQGTSASWGSLRAQRYPSQKLVTETATDHRDLVVKVQKHQGKADYIVIDGPPRIAELTRAILVMSDLCLVPVGASAAEVWATGDMLPLVEQAKALKSVDVRLLWTRFRAHTKLAQELGQQAQTELGLPALKTILGYRVAYAEALGQGMTAAEIPGNQARDEVVGLVTEIKRILK